MSSDAFDFGSPRPDINRKGKVFPCFVSSPLSRTEAIRENVARKKRRKLSRKEAPREQMTATIFTKFSLYSFHIFLRLRGQDIPFRTVSRCIVCFFYHTPLAEEP